MNNITNYDRIKNMSVEEMAGFIGRICRRLEDCCYCPAEDFCHKNSIELACCGCEIVILNWLEREVTEE